jgi:hypothetical protein
MMEIHGTIERNLRNALHSAKRLERRPVHPDTLQFWSDLVREARAKRAAEQNANAEVDQAIAGLELVIWSAKARSHSVP